MTENPIKFRNGFLLGIILGMIIGGLGVYVAYDLLLRQPKQRTEFDACIEECRALGRTEENCFLVCTLTRGGVR